MNTTGLCQVEVVGADGGGRRLGKGLESGLCQVEVVGADGGGRRLGGGLGR